MEEELAQEACIDAHAQLILLAASHHNLESLRTLLRTASANVQDPETGFTPLHAAIAACEPAAESSTAVQNGSSNGANRSLHSAAVDSSENGKLEEWDVEAAATTMRLLLQNGAIWNDVDKNDETPGCLASRLGLRHLYEIMVDAGVRAEMLLSRLDGYEQLRDDGSGDTDPTNDEDSPEMVNGSSGAGDQQSSDIASNVENDLQNENYLQSSLRFQDGRILDDSNNGVMMAWETDIMKHTVDLLVPKPGLRILNIGHGMGIIDKFFQEKAPTTHHIVEAHPTVLERMKKEGWSSKPNVVIHEGRWQDIVPKIIEQGTLFDVIYFDTFAEDYKALRDFFSDYVIGLLDDGGKWGFFNGLGADRQICYDVYAKVVEMDLFEAGFDTVWETVKVAEMKAEEWEGVKRRYWVLQEYKLPICEFIA